MNEKNVPACVHSAAERFVKKIGAVDNSKYFLFWPIFRLSDG